MRKIHCLLILLYYFLVAGVVHWFISLGTGGWYQSLAKPDHAPPAWFFPVVWPPVCFAAAWSFCLFVAEARQSASFWTGVRLYIMLGVLSGALSYLFFARQLPGLAVPAAAVLAGIAVLIIIFARAYSFRATLLLLPFFLWAALFASLSYEIFLLNR